MKEENIMKENEENETKSEMKMKKMAKENDEKAWKEGINEENESETWNNGEIMIIINRKKMMARRHEISGEEKKATNAMWSTISIV